MGLHTLPGNQFSQGAVVGVEVAVTGNTADGAGAADLPHCPGIGAAGGGTPSVVAAAGAPGIASVEVLAVVASDPGRERDRSAQVAAIAGADIDDRVQEVARLSLHVHRPVVVPGGVGTFRAANAAEDFAVGHRIDGFAVRRNLAPATCPEVVNLQRLGSRILDGRIHKHPFANRRLCRCSCCR